MEVPHNASKSRAQMQWMQAEKLQHDEEQEEHAWEAWTEQVLSFLPQAHQAYRNEVSSGMYRKDVF